MTICRAVGAQVSATRKEHNRDIERGRNERAWWPYIASISSRAALIFPNGNGMSCPHYSSFPFASTCMSVLVPRERIEQTILVIRGHRVMLDTDLAKLYGVTTFNLNKAVKRNGDRFPEDFMFRLSAQETAALTSQSGISKPRGRGGRRSAPYGFTEQGVAMLSSVLRSKRAIQVNIAIMRAFARCGSCRWP